MKKMKRWIGILLCCAMVLSCLSPVAVFAEESETKEPVTATITKGGYTYVYPGCKRL